MAFAALLLLAGCLESSSRPPAPEEPTTEERRTGRGDGDEGGSGHYESTFNLVVNPDGFVTVGIGGVSQANCVLFWDTGGADYVLDNGTATLTWDPVTPAAEELALYVIGEGAAPDVSGPSPLVLAIDDLEGSDWGVGFGADTPLGSAAVQQPVTLTLVFDHEGDLPGPGMGSCSNGL